MIGRPDDRPGEGSHEGSLSSGQPRRPGVIYSFPKDPLDVSSVGDPSEAGHLFWFEPTSGLQAPSYSLKAFRWHLKPDPVAFIPESHTDTQNADSAS